MEAARAGKHIFCEKPVALDLAVIDRALAVAKAGVKLQIGFNRRFDANFARVRQAIVGGEIGTPPCCTSSAATPARRRRLRQGLRRHVPGYDDPRLRHGALPDRAEARSLTQAGVTVDPAIGEAGDVDTASSC